MQPLKKRPLHVCLLEGHRRGAVLGSEQGKVVTKEPKTSVGRERKGKEKWVKVGQKETAVKEENGQTKTKEGKQVSQTGRKGGNQRLGGEEKGMGGITSSKFLCQTTWDVGPLWTLAAKAKAS